MFRHDTYRIPDQEERFAFIKRFAILVKRNRTSPFENASTSFCRMTPLRRWVMGCLASRSMSNTVAKAGISWTSS